MREGYINNIDEEEWGKEGNPIVIIVGPREEIWAMQEGIRACYKFSWDMDNFQVEVGEVNKPMGLSMVKGLGETEVGEVFVVNEDLDRKWGSMEVMSPGFQHSDDGKEFSVIDIVVSLHWGE